MSYSQIVCITFDIVEYLNQEYIDCTAPINKYVDSIEIPYSLCYDTIIEDCVNDTGYSFEENNGYFNLDLSSKFENICSDVLISYLKTRNKEIYKPIHVDKFVFENTLKLIDFLGIDIPVVIYNNRKKQCVYIKSPQTRKYHPDQEYLKFISSEQKATRHPVLNISDIDGSDIYDDEFYISDDDSDSGVDDVVNE